ncbi:hypothetical protein Asppvi_007858 [Aspergillus pseudoviridinutans]|uniref:Uncharacterized protein n=1 Tax=Aspergillus pseudoviridinutans TaxID=1517512 RepID=A0A9P3EXL6_9EURO|nr:uncharacterized protein Asppvi_007858 [Aspergillus pseudoviridinutans]GIJ88930.1 hypothetical protein Asppvi_007858 [Aspergillus pseudoviridinutans]
MLEISPLLAGWSGIEKPNDQIDLFNRRTLRHSGQMLFLDVKDSMDHHDAQQLSRLNTAHRSVAAALVIRLRSQRVANPTGIAVLTPYRMETSKCDDRPGALRQKDKRAIEKKESI